MLCRRLDQMRWRSSAPQGGQRSKVEHLAARADEATKPERPSHSLGTAAETTSQPAALDENAGKTIRPGPTRKHGAAMPCQRNTG